MPRLCVIDDDPIYIMIVNKLVTHYNLCDKPLVFKNGQEAIDFFKNLNDEIDVPDVILLDLNMPVMDGWEFLDEYQKIKDQLPKQVRLYISSSSANHVDVSRAEKYSFVSEYLVKPPNESILRKVLKAV